MGAKALWHRARDPGSEAEANFTIPDASIVWWDLRNIRIQKYQAFDDFIEACDHIHTSLDLPQLEFRVHWLP